MQKGLFKSSADLLCIILQYYLRSEMKRPYLNKDLQSQAEFIVENKVICGSILLIHLYCINKMKHLFKVLYIRNKIE